MFLLFLKIKKYFQFKQIENKVKMRKEIQNIYISLCVKIAIYTNKEDFILTPGIFELIVLNIVNEIELFSAAQENRLNGTEKRSLGIALINILLNDLLRKGKIDYDIQQKFSTIPPELFIEAKVRWRFQEEKKDSSCCIF